LLNALPEDLFTLCRLHVYVHSGVFFFIAQSTLSIQFLSPQILTNTVDISAHFGRQHQVARGSFLPKDNKRILINIARLFLGSTIGNNQLGHHPIVLLIYELEGLLVTITDALKDLFFVHDCA
jgi:hypothetical protein